MSESNGTPRATPPKVIAPEEPETFEERTTRVLGHLVEDMAYVKSALEFLLKAEGKPPRKRAKRTPATVAPTPPERPSRRRGR